MVSPSLWPERFPIADAFADAATDLAARVLVDDGEELGSPSDVVRRAEYVQGCRDRLTGAVAALRWAAEAVVADAEAASSMAAERPWSGARDVASRFMARFGEASDPVPRRETGEVRVELDGESVSLAAAYVACSLPRPDARWRERMSPALRGARGSWVSRDSASSFLRYAASSAPGDGCPEGAAVRAAELAESFASSLAAFGVPASGDHVSVRLDRAALDAVRSVADGEAPVRPCEVAESLRAALAACAAAADGGADLSLRCGVARWLLGRLMLIGGGAASSAAGSLSLGIASAEREKDG